MSQADIKTTKTELWKLIQEQYPDLAKFILELKKHGFTLETPVIYDRK